MGQPIEAFLVFLVVNLSCPELWLLFVFVRFLFWLLLMVLSLFCDFTGMPVTLSTRLVTNSQRIPTRERQYWWNAKETCFSRLETVSCAEGPSIQKYLKRLLDADYTSPHFLISFFNFFFLFLLWGILQEFRCFFCQFLAGSLNCLLLCVIFFFGQCRINSFVSLHFHPCTV